MFVGAATIFPPPILKPHSTKMITKTVFGYARADMAGIMIEDQVAPKRCGHVSGKSVVPFDEAVQRVKAACDAR